MAFKEIEFKYRADEIDFKKFEEFAKSRTPVRFTLASGYDHFYANSKDADAFCRHRVGPDMNQLTFKRKTTGTDNYIRTEHNIDMKTKVSVPQVEALCKEFGYTYNTSIFKTCFVYEYEYYTLVYYIVADTSMKEVGRFFEIEAKEDYEWGADNAAWDAIVTVERFCKPLGITPQGRMKKSLWELFRKSAT